ncbi:MAG: acetate kinase, partial [Eubacteriales bacterium]|nr:acetate kinase [Eubacteriales bacterium]
MKILVTNAGSTSLKFKLFEMPEEKVYCNAYIERVGSDKGIYTYDSETEHIHKENLSIPDYSAGIRMFIDTIRPHFDISEIKAVGFKTVLSKDHYGVHELTEEVLQGMRDFMFVAPAHNTAYLEAIESVKGIIKNVSLIGVFETAFHTTIPKERAMYSIPYEWYEKYGIKKMGYHGASHEYASTTAAQDGPASKIITCHLGGSCSICAVKDGKSVDTSFGLSLQVGIMNSNRIGDIDPYIMPYLLSEGMTMDEVMNGVGKKGGLLGVSGVSGDLREVIEAAENGNERAE